MTLRALLCAAAAAIAVAASPARADDLRTRIVEELEARPAARLGLEAHGFDAAQIDGWLSNLYSERDFAPLWLDGDRLGSRAQQLLALIEEADSHGIAAHTYYRPLLENLSRRDDQASRAQLDILLTLALGRLASDARQGQIAPHEIDADMTAPVALERADLGTLAREALAAPDLGAFVRAQYPQHVHYARLRTALARMRELHAAGGWPIVRPGPTLKPGQTDARVIELRARIGSELAAPAPGSPPDLYDDALAEQIRVFQADHGLDPDGAVGKRTIEALNVPVADRVRTILINLERWRWLARDLGDKFVVVNIAGYELFGLRNGGDIMLRMPVIVGKAFTSTPVFSDRIRYIELNPYWNVPTSIAADEILPKLRSNPGYLAGQHMRLFAGWGEGASEIDPHGVDWNGVDEKSIARFHIRQDPGAWNSLGTIKFMFPNQYDVYLHDTPARALFSRSERAFSHGCIRVSAPTALAEFLLEGTDGDWSARGVAAAIRSGENEIVRLATPVPIHITYRTAWVEADGSIQFRSDIYGRDARVNEALLAEAALP